MITGPWYARVCVPQTVISIRLGVWLSVRAVVDLAYGGAAQAAGRVEDNGGAQNGSCCATLFDRQTKTWLVHGRLALSAASHIHFPFPEGGKGMHRVDRLPEAPTHNFVRQLPPALMSRAAGRGYYSRKET